MSRMSIEESTMREEMICCVYIMTNRTNKVLYIGVTSNLPGRVYQHKNKELPGFTAKYNCTKLVYYETFGDIMLAIEREKEIKGWRREKKLALVYKQNPKWQDLGDGIL